MEPVIKVIFRKFPDGDVIALFPGLPGTANANTCSSYMHVGQHGAADTGLVRDTKPAARAEYAPLLKELRAIGYDNLRIAKRFTRTDREARFRALES